MRKRWKWKGKVLTASSDDRHNRGDIREEGEKKKTRKPREKVEKKVLSNKAACQKEISSRFVVIVGTIYTGCTHTFSSSDVNRAGDVGEALIHAHLQIDHPAKTHNRDWSYHPTQKCSAHHTLELHTFLCVHIHSLVSATVQARPRCQTHSSIYFVHTCCLTSTQTCWHRHKFKVSKEVREFSTHRRNLFCLD